MSEETITLDLSDGHTVTLALDMWKDLVATNRATVFETLGVPDPEDKRPPCHIVRDSATDEARLVVNPARYQSR